MKKSTVFGMAAAFACAAFAAQNDALVSFSTPGPDAYADGTTVRDGECYALVWTPDGSTFALSADGTASGGEMVLVAPVAKGGRCPSIVFQVPAEKAERAGGSWGVYLLDTRRWGSDGVAVPAGVGADGRLRLVNAAGAVAGSKVSVGAGSVSALAASGASVASSATAVPADAPSPEISAIRVVGGNVYVTVRNTVPYLQYDLSSGAEPCAVTERANAPRGGAAAGDGEITLVAPAKGGAAFFKVGRN